MCEHNFEYQGVVYSFWSQLPGSGAHDRVYEDRYFCTKCLAVVDKNKRISGNSYQHPIAGAFPK